MADNLKHNNTKNYTNLKRQRGERSFYANYKYNGGRANVCNIQGRNQKFISGGGLFSLRFLPFLFPSFFPSPLFSCLEVISQIQQVDLENHC